jgi:hypothetical protein
LDYCKDAQDLGTEFHYAWMRILISLVGWGEPKYNGFYPRPRNCRETTYTTLRHTPYAKKRKVGSSIFSMYFDEMKENIANTQRIPLEVVEEHQGAAKFKASKHNRWI